MTQPSSIKEVHQIRQLYIEAYKKHINPTNLQESTLEERQAREEHYRLSDEYRDALRHLPPGLMEEIDGVTYETVQISSPVWGSYVVIQTVEGPRDHFFSHAHTPKEDGSI